MSILEAVIFGAVQGFTEFLPVSSSGHLVLLERLFHISEPSLLYRVVLHLGTAIAVIVVCFKEIAGVVKKPRSKLCFYLFTCVLATGIIGILMDTFLNDMVMGSYVSYGFLITAVFLCLVQFLVKKREPEEPFIGYIDYNATGMKFSQCLAMGIAQGVAVLPGISRSGATICSGVTMGMDRDRAARFSFLVSVPVIFGSCLLELVKEWDSIVFTGFMPMLVGFIVSFITGFIAIKFMLKIVSKSMYYPFAVYLVVIGIASFFI